MDSPIVLRCLVFGRWCTKIRDMNEEYRPTIFAEALGRKGLRIFGVIRRDRLFHQIAFGQTGTGKSTLLLGMLRQDLANSQGFCLVDPHGDLAASVAVSAGSSVQLWNVADHGSMLGYNPLVRISSALRPLVASGLIDTLKRQWADAWGARMEHLLRYALLALLERNGSTLRDIVPMFLDKEFRRQVIVSVSDPQVRSFWQVEFPSMNYKTAVDGVAPIANKIGALLAHPVVRKALCEPEQPLRFRKIMDEGKVLIVNLAKGRLGADIANFVGGLIVSSFANAAMSRADTPEAERKPFFLYVDEFHSFTTSAFADMLSELRKYKLGLVLATQYTSQLDPDVREAIFGNVGTIMSFRVGATDAAIISKQFGADVPSERDLLNLPNYEMYLRLMIDGTQSKPFSARTLPPDAPEIRHAA